MSGQAWLTVAPLPVVESPKSQSTVCVSAAPGSVQVTLKVIGTPSSPPGAVITSKDGATLFTETLTVSSSVAPMSSVTRRPTLVLPLSSQVQVVVVVVSRIS